MRQPKVNTTTIEEITAWRQNLIAANPHKTDDEITELASWTHHPQAKGFFYKGQEVLSEAELLAELGWNNPLKK